MIVSRRFVILTVALEASVWTSAAVAQDRCEAQVLAQIQKAGIPPDDVAKVRISRKTDNVGDNRRVVGFDGWVSLNSCSGSFIVDIRGRRRP